MTPTDALAVFVEQPVEDSDMPTFYDRIDPVTGAVIQREVENEDVLVELLREGQILVVLTWSPATKGGNRLSGWTLTIVDVDDTGTIQTELFYGGVEQRAHVVAATVDRLRTRGSELTPAGG